VFGVVYGEIKLESACHWGMRFFHDLILQNYSLLLITFILMKKLLIIPIFLLAACASIKRSSSFTTDVIKPGASKQEVITRYGKPYKQGFSEDGTEILYYKEHIYRKVWYEVNTEMHFKNGALVSMEQGEEKRMDVDDRINR
jgi:hypothetical protein